MVLKKGDTVSVNGFVGEVISKNTKITEIFVMIVTKKKVEWYESVHTK